MTKANECTCPSGDGSLRHPCPAHIGPFDKLVGSPVHNESEPGLPPLDEHLAQVFETGMALSESVEQAGGDRWDALQSIMEWTASENIPDERKLCLIRNAARAALAQPSPKSGYYSDQEWINAGCPPEQPSPAPELERPEVVARVVHSNPVVLDQCAPLNANDELMTVAQHAASVARWAEMFNRVEQERDAALSRVAELEKQEPVAYVLFRDGEVFYETNDNIVISNKPGDETDLFTWRPVFVGPVAQAGQAPDEFAFEYRHPNGERHTVTVSREQVLEEMPDFIFEALCGKFCNCEPVGETNVIECRCDEYAEEFQLVTAAPGGVA